jgi:hypothetical protein
MTDICWIQHIKDRFGNYIGSNVLCENYIKTIIYRKSSKCKSSEINTWSMISLQPCPTLALHHMFSNSFANPRLNKSEIVLWAILDMNCWIFSTTRLCNCRSNPSSPNKSCRHWVISSWHWHNLGNHKNPKSRTSWTIILTKCPCSR